MERELEQFTNLEKFDTFLKVLSFYHTARCENDDCSQCFLVLNLRYLYTEHTVQQKEGVEGLKNYCRMQKIQVMCARLFLSRLAQIERQRIELEKAFNKTSEIWNKSDNEMPSPLPNF